MPKKKKTKPHWITLVDWNYLKKPKKIRGAKPTSGDRNDLCVQLTLRVPLSTRIRIDNEAKRLGITKSHLYRLMVDNYFQNQPV